MYPSTLFGVSCVSTVRFVAPVVIDSWFQRHLHGLRLTHVRLRRCPTGPFNNWICVHLHRSRLTTAAAAAAAGSTGSLTLALDRSVQRQQHDLQLPLLYGLELLLQQAPPWSKWPRIALDNRTNVILYPMSILCKAVFDHAGPTFDS